MLTRRRLVAAAGLAALAPLAASAADNGFMELLSSIKDRSEREYFERHRDDARWDGKYYYDRKSNKRYSRDEWRRELQRRHQDEVRRGGRNDRRDDRRDDRKDRRDDRKDRRDDRKDRRDDRRDDRR